ncbi:hypothetical protein [Ferrimonas aestuarii]|uniref:TM2 domain-containing protein n=1 Tax=Ferrimonas aestuarii TaxID=2569539 RepID=A0A4U1BMC4_9GAMM|nr:hypothetical protein [Ferrimonas aestuarii]TKB52004.1 hypothetical protein FCL42_16430 [Ferrimonas aestuarii]
MQLLQPIEVIEQQEELMRAQVNALPAAQRKQYFVEQSKQLKDPDTYATLNWLFLGGIHHLYLRRYGLFFIEITLLLCSAIAIWQGFDQAAFVICAVVIYELPQLFFSQRIARRYNLQQSALIFQQITGHAAKLDN